ncbi:hypothetical protein F0344_26120 [Streptomyces finlayi]|uniref:Integral membrane protein n=1 Tax=Streptomyces finlayi TaxID=67296 RepID=A0A7G7BQJ5_9ACTN|nr:DUF6328 family protein [Streptomyces finlayi]QNE77610.1 hypothetical protein F0344_26120 [Streptomyces finlayi]
MTDLQKSDDRQPTGTDSRRASAGRDETAAERADRRWVELLQEVRVAQTGVQILLAFLLSVAFTPRFTELGSTDRTIYVITIVLGAAATGALIAPVSFHRFVSGQQMKPQAVEWASRLTVTGLLLLLCTIMCALLLILRVVLHQSAALWIVSGVFLWFLACWVALPVWARWSK